MTLAKMKIWPTLKGRLKNPLTSELEALEQLSQVIELTEFAKRRKEKLKKCLTSNGENGIVSHVR